MPINLPILNDLDVVQLPTPPSDPPTLGDIRGAHYFTDQLMASHRTQEVTTPDLAYGLVYEHQVLSAATAVPVVPDWVEDLRNEIRGVRDDIHNDIQAMRRDITMLQVDMRGVHNDIRTLTVDVCAVQQDIRIVKHNIGQLDWTCSLMHNCARGMGNNARLKVVLFPNGENPAAPPHNLPPLNCPGAVRALSEAQRNAYYIGYYPGGHENSARIRTRRIFDAIGSKPLV